MNRQQLREQSRFRLNDLKADYLWSDDEINNFINQAINEALIRSRSVLDSTTPECCIINAKAGIASYPMNDAVFEIDRVYDSTNHCVLIKANYHELDTREHDWMTKQGMTRFYIDDMNHYGEDGENHRTLTLYPIPDADRSIQLTVYRTMLDELSDSDSPELPSFQHADLIHWVQHLAYMKADSDTLNVEKALEFEQQFTISFGERQSAQQLEWRRKRTKMTRVTGRFF
jgi:hypothetical protein